MRLRACLLLLFGIYAGPIFAEPIVSIQPSSGTFNIGDPFSLDISIRGAFDLYAFQFDLGFDPAVLSATSVTDGGFLGAPLDVFFIPGTIDNPSGSITFIANTLFGAVPGVSGNGVLASIGFTAIGLGTNSLITLSGVTLLDTASFDLDPPQPILVIVQGGGSVTVNPAAPAPVPEPATLFLFGTGLATLRYWRRRSA